MLGECVIARTSIINEVRLSEIGKIKLSISYKKSSKTIKFKVISYGSSMQNKLAKQMQNISPSSRRKFSSDGIMEGHNAVENFEALSLQVSQILCKELGTSLKAKNVSASFSQIKFSIPDGFMILKHLRYQPPRKCISNYEEDSSQSKSNVKYSCSGIRIGEGLCLDQQQNNSSMSRNFLQLSRSDQFSIEEIPQERDEDSSLDLPSVRIKTMMEIKNSSSKVEEIKVEEKKEYFPTILPLIQESPVVNSRRVKIRRITQAGACHPIKIRNFCHSNLDDVEKCSILVVDDDTINRMVLRAVLKRQGFNSIEARDGREACSLVERYINTGKLNELSLIFMDLQMPTMNGIQATKEILLVSSLNSVSAPPIIGVSANPLCIFWFYYTIFANFG